MADKLAQRIRSGELASGAWLPPERQIAESYGVGRNTVRKAIATLVTDGLAERVRNAGTRVVSQSEPAAPPSAADAGDVHAELTSIRGELERIDARLSAIEQRTETGEREH